jgi:hypothetical protein
VDAADRGRREVVEDGIATGHGIDRVRGRRIETELGRDRIAVELPIEPGKRARAKRHLRARGRRRSPEAPRVATEHPEVRQQVMAQIDRLGALKVRVPRHGPIGVALGQVEQGGHQSSRELARSSRAVHHEQRNVRRHLVVPGAPGVKLAADRPGQLGEPPLDRHVDVLVLLGEGELVALQLAGNLLEARGQGLQFAVVQHAGSLKRTRVRDRDLDVLRPEPAIEAKRRIDPPEERVLGCLEPGHVRA